jgi:hypothetical protein
MTYSLTVVSSCLFPPWSLQLLHRHDALNPCRWAPSRDECPSMHLNGPLCSVARVHMHPPPKASLPGLLAQTVARPALVSEMPWHSYSSSTALGHSPMVARHAKDFPRAVQWGRVLGRCRSPLQLLAIYLLHTNFFASMYLSHWRALWWLRSTCSTATTTCSTVTVQGGHGLQGRPIDIERQCLLDGTQVLER